MHQILLLVPLQEDLIEMMMVKVFEVEGAPVGAVEVEEEVVAVKTEIGKAVIQEAAALETEMIDIDQETAAEAVEEEEDLEIMLAVEEEEEPVPMIEALDLVMEEEVVEEENLTPLVRISLGNRTIINSHR